MRLVALAAPILAAGACASCTRHPELEPQCLLTKEVTGKAADMIGVPNKSLHPSLSHPKYSSEKDVGQILTDDDKVFFIRTRELTLVYPEVVLSLHHVINETIDGAPVAITQCRLTDSAVLYSRELDGEKITLGSLGTVLHGNDVLYDAGTESWWAQLTGACFSGKKAGKRLSPAAGLEQGLWGRVKDFPYVNVLMPQGEIANYRSFHEQMKTTDAGLKAAQAAGKVDPRLPPFTAGLGIVVRGEARFYPLAAIGRAGLIDDEVGGWGILVLRDERLPGFRILRRFLDGQRLTFTRDGLGLRDGETGTTWSLEGDAIGGKLKGKALERPAYTEAYWFAWAAFHPESGTFPAGQGGAAEGAASKTTAAKAKDTKEGTP